MLKQRDKLVTPGNIHIQYKNNSGEVIYDETYCPTLVKNVGTFESIDSVYDGAFTPGKFRANPVVISHGVGFITPGRLFHKSTALGGSYEVTGPFIGHKCNIAVGTADESLYGYALAKAYAKTKDADVELFVMAGELLETVKLLHNPMKLFHKALDRGPKNYRFGERSADLASSGWLTWLYGVMPLIQDISSILELLSKQHGQIGGLKRKAAKTSRSRVTFVRSQTGVGAFSFSTDATTIQENTVTAKVYYHLSLNHCSPWDSRVLGYSWPQLPKNLWEIVTRSFIVDWIIDVGSWLSNITYDPSVTYLGNCVSDKCVTTHRVTPGNPTIGGNVPADMSPSVYEWREERLVRKVNLSLPALPAFNRRFLDLKNLISSVALIWANLPRNWKRR